MHFDDRLATVLRQPATSKAIARIQFRQLLDLLGTLPADAHGAQVDAAYGLLAELSRRIDAPSRARMLGEAGLRLRSPRLVALLTEGEASVASAAISAAQMDEENWLDLIPALPIHARGMLRHRRDLGPRVEARLERLGIADRGLPASESAAAADEAPRLRIVETEPAPSEPLDDDGIGALVRRIEAFRKTRQGITDAERAADAPRLPLEEGYDAANRPQLASFDFATDPAGRISWADAAVAPMVVGLQFGSGASESPVESSIRLTDAIRQRLPIAAELVEISAAPYVSGTWIVDAAPCFDELTGRFTGYSGRARRPAGQPARVQPDSAKADQMRQVLHELRTPVGAIQLGAEMIQQQVYGPTPHEYRAIAAAIASDTARILAGFEELERLVKLDSGAVEIEPGESDLAEIVTATVAHLQPHTEPRKSGFAFDPPGGRLPVNLAKGELERLVWRILASLAGAAAPSELLVLRCSGEDGTALMEIALPASLAELDDEGLFHARAEVRPQALSAGMFGLGFTLRLASAEARAAGGSLSRPDGKLLLVLPRLTEASANLSQG